jgi:hypothetical protein
MPTPQEQHREKSGQDTRQPANKEHGGMPEARRGAGDREHGQRMDRPDDKKQAPGHGQDNKPRR